MKKIFGILLLLILAVTTSTVTLPVPVQAAVAGPQCSDGSDNDGDTFADIDDPQCHIDGDATNIDSYDPTIEQEVDTTAGCAGCGPRTVGGGGGGGPINICSDGKDNDGDGLVDAADPGCHTDDDLSKQYNPNDLDESNKKVEVTTPKPQVLGATTTTCGDTRPCTLQKTGGMTKARIAANKKAVAQAVQEKNILSIPSLSVQKPIIQGDSIDPLRAETWILPWTSTPDKGGNTVIVAHSYNLVKGKYSKSTFFDLETMKAGDTISVTWKGVLYTYEVSEVMQKVSPETISVEDQTEAPMLTLYGCGRYNNTYRTVVKAVLKK
jgi:LPXTG-site transpeptidase (sortase) family protein